MTNRDSADKEVSVCLRGMVLGITVPVSVAALQQIYFDDVFMGHVLWVALVFCGAIAGLINSDYGGKYIQIAARSALLGNIFAMGVILAGWAPVSWQCFGWYMMVLSGFHYSEYLCTALTNPRSVSLDSFLLNHSVAYTLAAAASWLEFWLERYWFPTMKHPSGPVFFAGLAFCLSGELVRKLAMFTARTNFNHIVQSEKRPGHVLVTHGVYSWFRHPSYVGWFWWSIGTQLILANPVCLLGYTAASWSFFRERVVYEEATLIRFFGQAYLSYQRQVGTGLPGIPGLVRR